jgi:hypothetical protein
MFAAFIGATAVAVIGGGIGWAAIPDSTGVIHGCYAKSNGALRAIDSAQTCSKTESSLNWNQTGRPGVSGRELVRFTKRCDAGDYTFSCHGGFMSRSVLCSSGKVPLGGGYFLVSGPNLISGLDDSTDFFTAGGAVIGSQPNDDAGGSWTVTLHTPDISSPYELTVYAVCAFAS